MVECVGSKQKAWVASLALYKQDLVGYNCDPSTWEVGGRRILSSRAKASLGWGTRDTVSKTNNKFSAVFGRRGMRQIRRHLPEQLNRPIRTFSHDSDLKEPHRHTFLSNGDRVKC